MAIYLGLDASTQSLSAVLIDTGAGRILPEFSVVFGQDLPEYGCPQGFLDHPDPLIKHSDPRLWAAALDLLLQRVNEAGFDLGTVAGISGSGQQHGTVYLDGRFPGAMGYGSGESLADMVTPLLTRATAPIWMDSSTSAECAEIEAAAGGADGVRTVSGSAAIERFAGPQIRKFAKEEPAAYAETGVIHLVSSFMCSLLTGASAPIDFGDGAGMNLLNLADGVWDASLADATASGLRGKLPRAVPSASIAGTLHPYFSRKYGFREGIPVAVWSGDNPNSLIGVGGWEPGTVVVSLGTSDTLFAAMPSPVVDPDGYGHVFGNPAGGFMCLICFKNGSLAREKVKQAHGLTWEQFDVTSFRETAPGNAGNLLLPYFVPEITPRVLKAGPAYRGSEEFRAGREPAAAVRGLIEAQAMSMKLHSGWIPSRPRVIRVTGGAAKSDGICRVLADVFDARVERLETGNSAGLGAAMRAANAVGGIAWADLTRAFCGAVAGKSIEPIAANVAVYAALLPAFAAFEKEHAGTANA